MLVLAKRPFDYECDVVAGLKMRTEMGTVYAASIEEAIAAVKAFRRNSRGDRLSRVRVEPRWPDTDEPTSRTEYPQPKAGDANLPIPFVPANTSTQSSGSKSEALSAPTTSDKPTTIADLWDIKEGLCYASQDSWFNIPKPLALYVKGSSKLEVKK